ncbi:MAG: LysR family transcriptional regulator [Pigmentiphaga sp.]
MNLKNFDLNLLVALDALLSECNVTRAAERLCVTQPAMSNALQRMREYFNDPILVRVGRTMQPTPLAELLRGPLREVMLQTGKILKADYNFDPMQAKRTLRIMMTDYCASVFSGPLMRVLSAEAPGIKLEVLPLAAEALDDMIAGKFEMLISAQDLKLMDPEVDEHLINRGHVFSDEFVCAVDVDNPHVGKELDTETYLRLPHAVTRIGNAYLSLEEQATRRLGLDIQIAATTPTFASLPSLLPGTPLIITLQKRLADQFARAIPMRTFAPPVAIPGLEETLYWHNRFQDDEAHAWMRNAIMRAGAQMEAR